ncbi:hypothetical protein [Shewanella atlantica]|uniref:Uncharacterized protein n=1 Tax=Shewanella atlantica TaxID=271099 RepID=A0A3S0INF4_9GAMM|nr:hypothetical protein [Shewanella atlantica]RTR27971.1 hypothetical protein EKG39_19625 [Shewanella atlantica]
MDKKTSKRPENKQTQEPSLISQLFPTEFGFAESAGQSKTLIIMLIIFIVLFGGFALFLMKMANII